MNGNSIELVNIMSTDIVNISLNKKYHMTHNRSQKQGFCTKTEQNLTKPVRLLTRSSTLELSDPVPETSTISALKGNLPIICSK